MMKIFARAQGFSLTPALTAWTHDRVTGAVAHHRDALRRVDVRLNDVNGPRGGCDKECRVTVRFIGGRTLTVRRRHADLYLAVRDAAEALGRRCNDRREHPRAQGPGGGR
jgi:ribosome-associated translation inhibitor RaiA